MVEKYQRLPYNGNLREAGREEEKIGGKDRLSKKRGDAGMNYGFRQLVDNSGKKS
jgi:hypothetical protein